MSNSSSSAKRIQLPADAPESSMEAFQMSFLLEAGKILASSLDYQKTLGSVAELVVPRLADWCVVNILNEDGMAPPLAVAHRDPAKLEFGWKLQTLYTPDIRRPSGIVQVLSTREPLLIADFTDEILQRMTTDPDHQQMLQELGLSSVIVVPMIARERVLGTISLVAAESGVHYDESDVQLAMELGNRAAIAIDNARLYEEAQQAIREKDKALNLLHEVLHQLPSGVIVAESSGEVILRNQAASEFWSFTSKRRDGVDKESSFFEAYHPDGRLFQKDEWPLMRALTGGEQIVGEEIELQKIDGEQCVLRINAAPLRDKEGNIIAAAVAFEDVTHRLSSMRALRESEEKFRTLSEVAPCAIFIHDGQNLLYVNQATCEITGYGREELLTTSFWSMLHPDSVPYIRERMQKRAAGQAVPSRFEAKIVTRDGTEKWIDFNGSLFEYEGKQVVICVALDITPRRQADEELQRSRERIRLAAESAGIGTWEWNIRNNVVSWSPELHRIFSYPLGEKLGSSFDSFLALVHDEDRTRVREQIELAASEHRDLNVEFRILRGDECWGWAFAKAKIFYDATGTPELMVGVAVDISGNKAVEFALRESEERFRVTFNQAAVGMAHVALDGTLVLVNHKLSEIFGYSEEEIFGRRFHEFTHPDDLPANVEKLSSMIAGEVSSYRLEKRYIRKDGSAIWAQVTSSLIKDDQGTPKYIIAVIEDITERRRAAEALRNSEKLAATGRLAASIAHEINNPLEAVTNLLYLLERNQSLDKTAKGYSQMAQEEISRVAHIARQTLGFYRDSSSLESVRVSSLMDDVLSLFDRKIRVADIAVTKDFETDGAIEAMPGEIRQVLSNLLANALDAAGKKGKLRIRVSRSRTWTGRSMRGVRVSIADNGSGITRENRQHLFEPFFTTKGAKGTGLGLWVTQGMVEKHSGKIRVWSSTLPGRSGTVFSVFLPLKQKNEATKRKISRVS